MRFSPPASAANAVACLLAAIAGEGFAQADARLEPSDSSARGRLSSFLEARALAERRRAAIEAEISANGPYSPALVDELNALAFLYREIGEEELAVQSLRQALQIVRANAGLFSLDQVPLMLQLIDGERTLGNAAAVAELESQLLGLAYRHPNDLRSADILRRAGDRQVELFQLYVDRALPPQITIEVGPEMAGRRPLPPARSAAIGAEKLYLDAIAVLHRTGAFDHEALPELERKLVSTYYAERTQTGPDRGRIEAIERLGRQAYERLIAYAAAGSGTLEERARALVELGDWELVFTKNATALDRYREAYAMLADAGGHDALLAELFTPDTPIALPTFVPNRFVPPSTSDARYVELEFDISKYGKTRAIHVTDLNGDEAEQAAQAMIRTIARRRFRPMLVDGEPMRASSVVVRYGF